MWALLVLTHGREMGWTMKVQFDNDETSHTGFKVGDLVTWAPSHEPPQRYRVVNIILHHKHAAFTLTLEPIEEITGQ